MATEKEAKEEDAQSPTPRRAGCELVFTRYVFTSKLFYTNLSCFYPNTCIAHGTTILLHDYCLLYDPHPPRPPLLYAMHYIILAMAILCEGPVAS